MFLFWLQERRSESTCGVHPLHLDSQHEIKGSQPIKPFDIKESKHLNYIRLPIRPIQEFICLVVYSSDYSQIPVQNLVGLNQNIPLTWIPLLCALSSSFLSSSPGSTLQSSSEQHSLQLGQHWPGRPFVPDGLGDVPASREIGKLHLKWEWWSPSSQCLKFTSLGSLLVFLTLTTKQGDSAWP